MKKRISIILLAVMLLQNCTVYRKRSVSLDKAYNKGKVKLITTTGNTMLLNNIEKTDTTYYYNVGSYKISISPDEVEGIHLYNQKNTGKWVAIGIGAGVILIIIIVMVTWTL